MLIQSPFKNKKILGIIGEHVDLSPDKSLILPPLVKNLVYLKTHSIEANKAVPIPIDTIL